MKRVVIRAAPEPAIRGFSAVLYLTESSSFFLCLVVPFCMVFGGFCSQVVLN